jgi:histidyl-tRNA synthetase
MSKVSKEIPAWQLNELDKPLLIASYFGFLPIQTPRVKEEDYEKTSDFEIHPHFNAAERAAFLRTYREKELLVMSHPLALSYKADSSNRKTTHHTLELVEYSHGVAEALLIRTSLSILLENGYNNLLVDINCIGDKDSISSYEQELQNFLKRTGTELPAEFKAQLKKDIFNLIKIPFPETESLRQNIPSSIAFLSAQSRSYFKEVLEHVESLEVEFRLNPQLVGHKNLCSNTIFAIKNADGEKEETLAVGYCYHKLSKRFGFKKEITLASSNIYLPTEPSGSTKRETAKKLYKIPKPKFYLVQLGREAKMKSLTIIELLRRERIPVYHILGKDKITSQLTAAESLRVPYLIIIGHKEALDNTATVRNTSTRAQDTVPLSQLPFYLKNLTLN